MQTKRYCPDPDCGIQIARHWNECPNCGCHFSNDRFTWIHALIEAKSSDLMSRYVDSESGGDLLMDIKYRKQLHDMVKSHDFLYWYICPNDAWTQVTYDNERTTTKRQWKNIYRTYRLYIRRQSEQAQ